MQRSLIVLALVAGCSQSLGRLSIVGAASPTAPAPSGPRVTGQSCALWLFGFPLGAPSLEAATRAAAAVNRTPTLEDVIVTKTFWSTALVGRECLIVGARATATVARRP